jgi:PadR family transcriptional regulator
MSGSDIVTGTLELLILKTLERGTLHGYGIGRAIGDGSGRVLRVSESVLYPALHRLESRGHLTAQWRVSDTGREARFYALTRKGRNRLQRDGQRWIERSEAVLAILAGGRAL